MAFSEESFKITLIKVWESKYPELYKVTKALNRSNVFIEYTSLFTRREWNTYCAILHIKAPFEFNNILDLHKDKLFNIAENLFGKQDDYYLTNISIDILVEEYDYVDFSIFGKSETIKKSIEDAENFIQLGKYSSAIDRVHTTFHGYLRMKLDELEIEFEESDTIMQLYSKLHNSLEEISSHKLNALIKSSIRSASGVIDTINTIRNKHSLSHPNEEIVEEPEAKLVINLSKQIFEYIEGRV
ncbi:abortive infection family protein [Heyndrickxia coagulans]|uniref:abortive infection family protein n=1 Tax=Heyndrickxia coagulans TaxID=1398 RepID=UPI002E03B1EC|nr:abortive infection family protein [Heyndrickxia coagulans]MED4965382.1 abortive infection family protein [Heyndrickxia coagulans]